MVSVQHWPNNTNFFHNSMGRPLSHHLNYLVSFLGLKHCIDIWNVWSMFSNIQWQNISWCFEFLWWKHGHKIENVWVMFMPEPRENITPYFLNVFNQPFRVSWQCFTKKSSSTLWIFWLMFFMPESLKHGLPHVEFSWSTGLLQWSNHAWEILAWKTSTKKFTFTMC